MRILILVVESILVVRVHIWFFNVDGVKQWFQYNSLRLFLGFIIIWIIILLFVLIYFLNSL